MVIIIIRIVISMTLYYFYIHIYIYIYTYVCLSVCVCAHACVYVCVCVCARGYVGSDERLPPITCEETKIDVRVHVHVEPTYVCHTVLMYPTHSLPVRGFESVGLHAHAHARAHTHTHTHTHLGGACPGVADLSRGECRIQKGRRRRSRGRRRSCPWGGRR